MTEFNVKKDYGAAGDGSTDDTGAIQSAVDDATDGDTVVVPATSEYYRVTAGGGTKPAVDLTSIADNVTIRGDGPDSKLVIDRTSDTGVVSCMGTTSETPSWTAITVRGLVFDGNRSNNGDSFAFRWGGPRATGRDVLMEDCVFQNAVRTGLSTNGDNGFSRMTFQNCTARGNGGHGFDPVGTGEGSASDPEVKFFDVKAVDNDGISIDFHRGNHLCDGFYTNNNENGTKMGAAGGAAGHVTLRNCNIRNSRSGNGFYQSFPDDISYTLTIDNVQFVGHYQSGVRLDKQGDVTVEGPLLAGNNAEDSNDVNVRIDDGCSVDASNGTIRVQNGNSNAGLYNGSGSSSTIGTLYHYNNPGGAYNDGSETMTVESTVNEEVGELAVPGSDDVGAFTGDWSSSDGSTDPLFDDWTPRWDSGESGWSVSTTSSNEEDTVLELSASSSGRHALSSDPVGTPTDVDVLGLVRVPSNDDSSSSWCRLVGRGAGSSGSETGYFVSFRDVPSFNMGKYVDGGSAGLASTGIDAATGTWLYVRFNVTGDELKARYWPYGEEEPTTWDLTATDSEIVDSGWVGVGGWSTDTQQWDAFSVGTGGESAELVGTDSSPDVSWSSPDDGTTVSDTVTVQIAASDLEDSIDSLTTEYRVDGASWSTASYNSNTGLYEDEWDTTAVSDGDHDLEARVTDSAGNTATATITVTTDNATAAPAVDALSLMEVDTESSDAEFDADWGVSDGDGDLSSVELELRDSGGTTEDSTTASVGGDTATGATRLVAADDDGSGTEYTATLTVTDSDGNTASDTASATASDDTGQAPSINRFSVSEAGRPDPWAEVTAVWDVSDADGDLASVDIEVADADGTVAGVSWTVSGAGASDTDSFRIRDGDGTTFDVTVTVTDESGLSTADTKSVTA